MVSYARNHNGQALEGAENVTVQYHDTIDENIQVGDVLWMSGHVGLYVGKSEDGSFMTVDHGGSGAALNCSLASGDGWTGPKYRDGSFFTGYIHYEGIPSLATGGTGASSGEFLITSGYNKDSSYKGTTYKLSDSDRDLLERVLSREYGSDYEGSVLVAQCMRDSLVNKVASSPQNLVSSMYFGAEIPQEKTENAKNAIKYVFDEGGSGLQHRIYVYYDTHGGFTSSWHETQQFVYSKPCFDYTVKFFDFKN